MSALKDKAHIVDGALHAVDGRHGVGGHHALMGILQLRQQV